MQSSVVYYSKLKLFANGAFQITKLGYTSISFHKNLGLRLAHIVC